ncbi:nucleotide disphospho-sugar-binding domain-containing protein [Kitasatospora sp. NPDC086791]|uniref:nucleotide disphospho-sugar-binding domain-containing protein n=1 Tax=Kitasatospora sp. NPDC086791 TaxID=3155178 RepID=UPI003439C63A
MRVLMTSISAPGHVTPLVPLAWALRGAGHEVVIGGQPNLMPTVRGAGLCGQPIGEAFDQLLHLRNILPGEESPIEAWGRVVEPLYSTAARTWATQAHRTVDEYLDFCRAWAPDLIVAEPFEFCARLMGGVLDVPWVRHRIGLTGRAARFEESAAEALAPVAGRLGLKEGAPEPVLTLDTCPPSFGRTDAAARRPMRYVPYNGTGAVPDWALAPRPGARRVCVSLGTQTLVLNGVPLLRRIIEAVRGIDGVEVVVTLTAADRESLGDLPEGVRVVESLPLNLFLDRCDVVIHHGGAGSCLTATAFGVPQLVVPQFLDQFEYGDRLAAAGAGITLDSADKQNDVEGIRRAVGELLDDPAHVRNARRLREEIQAMPSPGETVAVLERLAVTG